MAESDVSFPYKSWERFCDAIGPEYCRKLFEGAARARVELSDVAEDQLCELVASAHETMHTFDEDGARQTVRLQAERNQHAAQATALAQEAQQINQTLPRSWILGQGSSRRAATAEATKRGEQAELHRAMAARAQERLRDLANDDRHLYEWFERHSAALALGLAAEQRLGSRDRACYHVLGAPSIASLTANCLTSERAIELDRLHELVQNDGDPRQDVLLGVASELRSGDEQQITLTDLLEHLHGEDLERVLDGIAILKRRAWRSVESPTDLWIRAAEPNP